MARIQIQNLQRDKKKERRVMWIAIALGLLALALNLVWMRKVQGARLSILKAKQTVTAGTKISRGMFDVITISGDLEAMKSTFLTAEEISSYEQLPLEETVQSGHVLMLNSFYGRAQVPPGKVWLPIEARDDVVTGEHSLRRNDLVDVWAWINGQQHKLRACAQVGAVGNLQVASASDGREMRYTTVTIIVEPDEVAALLTNLQLADHNIRLTPVGQCSPNPQKALPPLNTPPEARPEPLPTPSPGKGAKKQKRAAK